MEKLQDAKIRMSIAIATGALVLTNCGGDQESQTPAAEQSSPVPSVSFAMPMPRANANNLGLLPDLTNNQNPIADTICFETIDADCDEVIDVFDVLPGVDDNADNDGDFVPNKWDKWPYSDDKQMDSDGDTVPDWLDTFWGNNFLDFDNDGVINCLDVAPYISNLVPTPTPIPTPPPTLTNEQLNQILVEEQMRRAAQGKLFVPDDNPDEDWFTNDRDGDREPDFYDPEPGDPYVDSRNDPFDPRNDEYWDDVS